MKFLLSLMLYKIIFINCYNLCNTCKYQYIDPIDKSNRCLKNGKSLLLNNEVIIKYEKCNNIKKCYEYNIKKNFNYTFIDLNKLK
jgi:hypothetical protein